MSLKSAFLGTVLLLGAVGTANAAPLTWTLSGVQFDDGGIATGSFRYDAATGTFSDVAVSTSGGIFAGANYSFVTDFATNGFVDLVPISPVNNLTNIRNLSLTLAALMTDSGGVISLLAFVTFGENTCSTPNCGSAAAFRDVAAGSISAVPIPAALPLLASGLGALGFIGWRRKRKAVVAA